VEAPKDPSRPVTYTKGDAASEIEVLLGLFEKQITASDLSAADLHTLASLIIILGKYVSRLAKEKDDAIVAARANARAAALLGSNDAPCRAQIER